VEGRKGKRRGEEKEGGRRQREGGGKEGREGKRKKERVDPQGFSEMTLLNVRSHMDGYLTGHCMGMFDR